MEKKYLVYYGPKGQQINDNARFVITEETFKQLEQAIETTKDACDIEVETVVEINGIDTTVMSKFKAENILAVHLIYNRLDANVEAVIEQPVTETPVVEKVEPVVEDVTPAVEEVAPVVEEITPVVEEITPVVEEIEPTIEEEFDDIDNTIDEADDLLSSFEGGNYDSF